MTIKRGRGVGIKYVILTPKENKLLQKFIHDWPLTKAETELAEDLYTAICLIVGKGEQSLNFVKVED